MITSAHNPRLRYVKNLARRAFRGREDCLVVEGVRAVEDALAAGAQPQFALVTPAFSDSPHGHALCERLAAACDGELLVVDPARFDELTDTVHAQGVLAVFATPHLPLAQVLDFVLVLDAVRDPGNLGTALRTAAAAGVGAVVLAPGTVDPTNPKVVRAAMGAHFRVPLRLLDWAGIRQLAADHGLTVWIADAAGETEYSAVDWRSPVAVVVGGEARGPSMEALGGEALGREGLEVADPTGPRDPKPSAGRVRIPMPGQMESLNAAVAAGVMLFQVVNARSHRAVLDTAHPGRAG